MSPLIYQGWFVQCDYCGENDQGNLGGRPRKQAVEEALRGGWIRRKGKWYCQSECLQMYRRAHPSEP